MALGVDKRGLYQPISDINVTPLVDVMLVLLVIFMITSPLLVAGVKVDLPETSASPLSGQDEPLAITVDSKGRIYLQETKVRFKDLVPKIKAIVGAKKETRIFVRGDKNINYGKVMQVVGAIHAAGYRKIGLITEIATP